MGNMGRMWGGQYRFVGTPLSHILGWVGVMGVLLCHVKVEMLPSLFLCLRAPADILVTT